MRTKLYYKIPVTLSTHPQMSMSAILTMVAAIKVARTLLDLFNAPVMKDMNYKTMVSLVCGLFLSEF